MSPKVEKHYKQYEIIVKVGCRVKPFYLAKFFAALHRIFSFDHSVKSKTRPIRVKSFITTLLWECLGLSWSNVSLARIGGMKGYTVITHER